MTSENGPFHLITKMESWKLTKRHRFLARPKLTMPKANGLDKTTERAAPRQPTCQALNLYFSSNPGHVYPSPCQLQQSQAAKFPPAPCFLLHHCANASQLTAERLGCSLLQSCAAVCWLKNRPHSPVPGEELSTPPLALQTLPPSLSPAFCSVIPYSHLSHDQGPRINVCVRVSLASFSCTETSYVSFGDEERSPHMLVTYAFRGRTSYTIKYTIH